jgi:hypothetical protein
MDIRIGTVESKIDLVHPASVQEIVRICVREVKAQLARERHEDEERRLSPRESE